MQLAPRLLTCPGGANLKNTVQLAPQALNLSRGGGGGGGQVVFHINLPLRLNGFQLAIENCGINLVFSEENRKQVL